ncbi:MAG: hypothetical protein HOG60_03230 [Gammaproteobacteria bacterium]|nr:hypothetical protein [Gammaproteobacteria bacterium]
MFIFPELGRMIIVGLMILVPVCLIYKKAGFHLGGCPRIEAVARESLFESVFSALCES